MVPEDGDQGPVTLIESGAFGGLCINRGCVPSKILIQTAHVAAQVRHASEFGIEAELTGVDWPALGPHIDDDSKPPLVRLAPQSLTAGRTLGRDHRLAVGEGSEIGPHRNAAEAGYVGTALRPG